MLTAIIVGILSLLFIISLLVLAACRIMEDVHTRLHVYKDEEYEEDYLPYDGLSGQPLQHPSNFTDFR